MFSLLLRTVTVLLTILFAVTSAHAYTAYNGCPNLSNLGASYVEAYTGRTWEPMQDKGVVEGRHTVISTQGTDPYTDNKLKLLPEGATSVVRLGNDLAEAETDVLVYHFRVDADNPILKLRYAVVMENPGHAKHDQPYFKLEVLDARGSLIDRHSQYEVYANANASGFHASSLPGKLGSSIIWSDWTSMGVDLSSMVGKEVQIRVIVYDCALYEHFAYAYFTAECIQKIISIENCKTTSFQLVAPEGFKSYKWSTGSTDRTITVSNNQSKQTISCTITSMTGASFTLYTVLGNTSVATGKTINETVVVEDEYTYEGIKLPTINSGSYRFDYYNTKTCSYVGSNNVNITVDKKPEKMPYLKLHKGICEGDDYIGYGFKYIQPAVGTYRDTLPCTTCTESYPQYYVLNLTVSPTPRFPKIEGPLDICQGETAVYRAEDAKYITNYHWLANIGGNSISKAGAAVEVEFPNVGTETIKLEAGNACDSKSMNIKVNVHPTYKKIILDTICVGTKYNKYGFNLGTLTSEGTKFYSKALQSVSGCDSTIVLGVLVAPEVNVRIQLNGDSVLCEGKEVTLTAKGGMDFYEEDEIDYIRPGDIHCSDGTILHPEQYVGSGKVADGIIAYVDDTDEHGYMIGLDIKQYKLTRSDVEKCYKDIYESFQVAMSSMNGYEHSGVLRENGFVPALEVDYDNGWFIPSLSEMNRLETIYSKLNQSLQLVGGDLIEWKTVASFEAEDDWIWLSSSYKFGNDGLFNGVFGMSSSATGYNIFLDGTYRSDELRPFFVKAMKKF